MRLPETPQRNNACRAWPLRRRRRWRRRRPGGGKTLSMRTHPHIPRHPHKAAQLFDNNFGHKSLILCRELYEVENFPVDWLRGEPRWGGSDCTGGCSFTRGNTRSARLLTQPNGSAGGVQLAVRTISGGLIDINTQSVEKHRGTSAPLCIFVEGWGLGVGGCTAHKVCWIFTFRQRCYAQRHHWRHL